MISWIAFLLIIILSLIGSLLTFLVALSPYRFKGDEKYRPKVSVIIPSRNEEKMIADVIEAWLKVDYPKDKMEIICTDNSNDKTPSILKGYAKKYKMLRYFESDTKTKLGAVLSAVKESRNPVILLSDSDVLVSPMCVKECLKYLADKNIGAVFGKRVPVNYKRGLFSRWDALRLLKTFVSHKFFTRIDSSLYFSASPCAMRKKDLVDIKKNDELIADDLYMALHIRKKGLRVVFNPSVEGRVGVLHNIREVFVRNPRSYKGTAQIALGGYEGTLGRRKYGRFGMFTVPYKEFLYLGNVFLYPALFITIFVDLITSILSNNIPEFLSYISIIFVLWYAVMLFGTFLFTLIVTFVIKHRDWTFFIVMLLDPFISLIDMTAGFIGFYSYLFGRKVEWKKTTSDRS
jgi:cellulose synthase/poly-beta-1,6-N-acetylglucosamine synthase-like glycosyltransferase